MVIMLMVPGGARVGCRVGMVMPFDDCTWSTMMCWLRNDGALVVPDVDHWCELIYD